MAASVFNTSGTYNSAIGGDGVGLLSQSHPVDGTVWANRPKIDVDLGESTLLSAQVQIRRTSSIRPASRSWRAARSSSSLRPWSRSRSA